MREGECSPGWFPKTRLFLGPRRKSITNFFLAAQCNYYPLVWMIHSRFNNNQGKYLKEIFLWLISYEKLLLKDESVCYHQGVFQFDFESGIAIFWQIIYWGPNIKSVKNKKKQILQMTWYFIFRMQKQHKIILLSPKIWVNMAKI